MIKTNYYLHKQLLTATETPSTQNVYFLAPCMLAFIITHVYDVVYVEAKSV